MIMINLKEWIGIYESQKREVFLERINMQRHGCLSDLRTATSLRVDEVQGMEKKTARDKARKLITRFEPTFLSKGIR